MAVRSSGEVMVQACALGGCTHVHEVLPDAASSQLHWLCARRCEVPRKRDWHRGGTQCAAEEASEEAVRCKCSGWELKFNDVQVEAESLSKMCAHAGVRCCVHRLRGAVVGEDAGG